MWQRDNGTCTIEFKSACRPTPVRLNHLHLCRFIKKTHTLCNQCLFYFVWRKCHDFITVFLENKKVPLLLNISIHIEGWDFCPWSIVPTSTTTNTQNFMQGTQCPLKMCIHIIKFLDTPLCVRRIIISFLLSACWFISQIVPGCKLVSSCHVTWRYHLILVSAAHGVSWHCCLSCNFTISHPLLWHLTCHILPIK